MQGGLATRKLSLCPSVYLSNAWIVTKCKIDLSRFLTLYERLLTQFSEKKSGWWGGNPFYLKFWVIRPPLERNRRFSVDIRS